MADIERRAFVKGATLGALAFTVGGSTVMLTTRQARAGNVPFRMLKENEAETIESMGETLVPGASTAGIAHFIDQQISCPPEEALLQARIFNVKPPFANFYRAAVKAHRRRQRQDLRPQVRDAVGRRQARVRQPDARRTRPPAGRARPVRSSTTCCAATPSTSSIRPWRATRRLAFRTWPTSRPSGGGDMATNEKVDVVIVGAGASGSVYASVLAKAGKKVVLLDNGPDWQLQDLISSEFWGRRIKPAGAPIHARGQASVRLHRAGRLGRRRRGAALLRQFPALSADRLQDQERAQPRPRLADLLRRCRAVLRQGRGRDRRVRRRQAGGEVAAGRQALSDAADEDLPQRPGLAQGRRGQRHPLRAGRGRHDVAGLEGPAGLPLRRLVPRSAVRPARSPIRW